MSSSSFRDEESIPEAAAENVSNCNGSSLQEVRIYDYRDFPNLVSASLVPGNSALVALATSLDPSLSDHRCSTIVDEDQVPNSFNQRTSVLYQPTFIKKSSLDDLSSPNQSMGGCFCSLLSNEKSLENTCSLKRPESNIYSFNQINTYSYNQDGAAMKTSNLSPEAKELAEIKTEISSLKREQSKTLRVVQQISEEVSNSKNRHGVSDKQLGQVQLLKEMNDKLVQMHQDMSRLVLSHQQGFDDLSNRLGRLEESMTQRKRSSRIKIKTENVSEEPWEKPSFTCIGTFSGHESAVTCLVTHQNQLMSGSASGEIRVWDTTDLKCVMHATFSADAISCMALSQEFLFVANGANSLFMIDLNTMKIASLQLEAHVGGVFAMCIVDNFLFTSSMECIKVWRVEDFKITYEQTIDGLPHSVRALHVDSNQSLLYSGAHNSVHAWNTKSPFQLGGKLESKRLGTIYSLTSIEDCLFVGTYNQSIHVINKNTFHTIKILQSHIACITILITGPGEGCVISGSMDASVVVWHTPIMLAFQKLERHKNAVNALAIVNEYLFTAGGDGEIKVFKVAHAQTQNQLV